ncbi:2-amino-4-hydroxy-6-hydroxymethyldihydropteridine diphosphokinase [Isobaculum melis]|uniref:2-amino-4-hydroxy-6-hydroxymethyldihydropteridine diphosphokinase n=1 Tax=Isobaculum melis TaxID=142588 RepID=A0A1H9QXK9_9LACT|nr:2-amino-4-hydroxy-6-hydroxymethyldihydropteridine diphosphokinase [Isobaculum melis]SER64559.1 2-amino-4-hydroxy-6-hydroxymethyldihydropteridinediphosphokinase [Isobaculum melis]
MTTGYLALGSNLGDRLLTLKKAVTKLEQTSAIQVVAKSIIYETLPYGDVPQDNYLNAVLRIETALSPLDLLNKTQQIEQELGRVRTIHWGPRTIDIDLLLLGDTTLTSERLILPHKEITKRSFVLIPLADVYVNQTLFGQSLPELIEATGNQQEVWKSKESWESING